MRAAVVIGALSVLFVGSALAADQLITGKKLKAGIGVLFTSSDPTIVPPEPASPDDPTSHNDWIFEIFADGSSFAAEHHDLPTSFWTANAGQTVFKYKDRFASAAVRTIVLKPGKLKVKVQVGQVPYGAGAPIAVVLGGGSLRYCARFDLDTWLVTGPLGKFVAKNALAPVECPTLAESPSGAFVQ